MCHEVKEETRADTWHSLARALLDVSVTFNAINKSYPTCDIPSDLPEQDYFVVESYIQVVFKVVFIVC